jgi:uridine kinase
MVDIDAAVEMILAGRRRVPAHESMLVAVSGIDGSGKGYVTERIIACIQRKSLHAVTVNVDGWLNFPSRRFHKERPEEHFYRHAIRFDDMFEQLILPLKRQRSIRVEADLAEETATVYHRHVYDFRDVNVIVLEGIYLLKRTFRRYYDLAAPVIVNGHTPFAVVIIDVIPFGEINPRTPVATLVFLHQFLS